MNKTLKILLIILVILLIGWAIYYFLIKKNEEPMQKEQVTTEAQSEQASWLNTKYLMAFHACDTATTDCLDPKTHQTYVAQSDDGKTWQPIPDYKPYKGSVPDIIRRKNTIYVFNPGMVRRYRIDTDTWENPISIDMEGNQELFVDPSAILDEDNNIVLFYLVGQMGGDPARCMPGQSSCTKIFHSATEVEGSDGTKFVADEGNRVEIEISANEVASDPDIFKGPEGFVLYISLGKDIQVHTANSLRANYKKITGLTDGILSKGLGSVPAGYYDANTGQYWTYVHTDEGKVRVIRQAVHNDLNAPLIESDFTTVISGADFPGLESSCLVESPGFAVNTP